MTINEQSRPAWQEEARLIGTLIRLSLQSQAVPVQLEAISRALMQLTLAGAPGEADARRLKPLIDRIGVAAGHQPMCDLVAAYAFLLHDLAAQTEEHFCEASREGSDPISEGEE